MDRPKSREASASLSLAGRGAVTTENEWVKLPEPAPTTLPAGAKVKTEGNVWTLETEHTRGPISYRGTHVDRDGERFEDSVIVAWCVREVQNT
jgi:hypothetical protein